MVKKNLKKNEIQKIECLIVKTVQNASKKLSPESFSKRKTSHQDIVTNNDLFIEQFIINSLIRLNLPILSEEVGVFNKEIKDKTYLVIDPIDGSACHSSGLPFYAISIGFIEKNKFKAGAVQIPAMNITYNTSKGKAFKNNKKIKICDKPISSSIICASFSREAEKKIQYALFSKLDNFARLNLRLGCTALNICYVAEGLAQVAYGYKVKLWDIAGALPIAIAAGAKIYFKPYPNHTCDYVIATPKCFKIVQDIFIGTCY